MLKFENHLGTIYPTQEYLISLVEHTVKSCFGVGGISDFSSPSKLLSLFKNKGRSRGIEVEYKKGKLFITVNIIASFGVNINETVKGIVSKIKYTVESATSFPVEKVNVYIDTVVGN